MKKTLLICILLLTGCAQGPTDPQVSRHYSFFGFLNAMDQPEKVSAWLDKYSEYDERHNTGTLGGGDLIAQGARYIWAKQVGACFQQAALFVYSARWHGHDAGIVVIGPLGARHAIGWIALDGKITTTNGKLVNRDSYETLDDLLAILDVQLTY
jgi:hypothetical protein